MIGQFKVAFIMQQLAGFAGPENVEKHLVGFGGDHAHRAIAHLNRRALRLCVLFFVQIRPLDGRRQSARRLRVTMASSSLTEASEGAPPISPVP